MSINIGDFVHHIVLVILVIDRVEEDFVYSNVDIEIEIEIYKLIKEHKEQIDVYIVFRVVAEDIRGEKIV